MKTLADVMAQAEESEAFDTILREAAKNAVTQGVGSTEWKQLMNFFAESPGELDELSAPHLISNPQKKINAFRTGLAYTSATCPTVGQGLEESADATTKKSVKAQQPRRPTKKTR
jgi:hypothetical protein